MNGTKDNREFLRFNERLKYSQGVEITMKARHSSGLSRNNHSVRLRQHCRGWFHETGHTRGDLLQLPPVFYRQTEVDRYGRPHRTIQKKIRKVSESIAPLLCLPTGFVRCPACITGTGSCRPRPFASVHREPHLLCSRAFEVRLVRLHARRRASAAPCKRLPYGVLPHIIHFNPVNG